MSNIIIPYGAEVILNILRSANYDAYVVGGCVRDSLLGIQPKDWDICTSAKPDVVKNCLSVHGIRTINTGLKHGTVTADMGYEGMYEITTFRVDGEYSDGRHPDNIKFVSDIYTDLSRRDFTINAIAYNHNGVIDPFNGMADLENGVVSCVGDPDDRFKEDALRILRAIRFASIYGFKIDDNTATSIHKNKSGLNSVSAERVQAELVKILTGEYVLDVLLKYSDVISEIIPEMGPCVGFNQNNRFHEFNVYDHISHAVSNYKGSDIVVKMALLLHDIGKPKCYSVDCNGGHFYGHGVQSRDISVNVLDKLRFDNKTKADVLELVLYHDSVIEPTQKTIRRWLRKIGEKQFRRLLDIQSADIMAHSKWTQQTRIEKLDAIRSVFDDVVKQEQCFQMRDLSINGNDIMRCFGISEGKMVGDMLGVALDGVVDGVVENSKERLVEYIKAQIYKR